MQKTIFCTIKYILQLKQLASVCKIIYLSKDICDSYVTFLQC